MMREEARVPKCVPASCGQQRWLAQLVAASAPRARLPISSSCIRRSALPIVLSCPALSRLIQSANGKQVRPMSMSMSMFVSVSVPVRSICPTHARQRPPNSSHIERETPSQPRKALRAGWACSSSEDISRPTGGSGSSE